MMIKRKLTDVNRFRMYACRNNSINGERVSRILIQKTEE